VIINIGISQSVFGALHKILDHFVLGKEAATTTSTARVVAAHAAGINVDEEHSPARRCPTR